MYFSVLYNFVTVSQNDLTYVIWAFIFAQSAESFQQSAVVHIFFSFAIQLMQIYSRLTLLYVEWGVMLFPRRYLITWSQSLSLSSLLNVCC